MVIFKKRVGTRLRNLTKSSKEILSDGKKLGGAGRLTENVNNTLQNYYGKAIRQNIGNLYAIKKSVAAVLLYAIKKSVAAVLFHCSESYDSETRHQFCLRTKDSWCKFQADKVTEKKTKGIQRKYLYSCCCSRFYKTNIYRSWK